MSDAATLPVPDHAEDELVRYSAVLPLPRRVVTFVADLLTEHQARLGTRTGRRAAGPWDQAVALCRWMLEGVEPDRLGADLGIGGSTAHRYVNEALDVLADRAPSLRGALIAARAAGHTHVNLDGTLVRTDRLRAPGPTTARTRKNTGPRRVKVDLWWSGKHRCHGGNIQIVTAPDGWPLWVSGVRPGREHDVTCARADPDLLPTLAAWADEHHVVLADLGYEGERDRLVLPVRPGTNGTDDRGQHLPLSDDQACYNQLHSATRARAEAGNAWLKQTFKILRHVRISPSRIGALTAAALVLLHLTHDRTT